MAESNHTSTSTSASTSPDCRMRPGQIGKHTPKDVEKYFGQGLPDIYLRKLWWEVVCGDKKMK
jgi:hypothetical protein